jgi:hypothetical protein
VYTTSAASFANMQTVRMGNMPESRRYRDVEPAACIRPIAWQGRHRSPVPRGPRRHAKSGKIQGDRTAYRRLEQMVNSVAPRHR